MSRQISFTVSDDTFKILEVEKERYGTWKFFLLYCVISKLRRVLALPGYQEHTKRRIKQIQIELGGPAEADPRITCPHCHKEF
jgi:hypothetical protein